MGLSGFNTFFRYLAFLSGGVAFGFDMYMIYLYNRTPTMFLDWPFYGQAGLTGCLLTVLFLSEICYRIGNHYQNYRAIHSNGLSNQVEEGTQQHFPSVREGQSSPSSATFVSPYIAPPKPNYPLTRKEIVDRRRAGLKTLLSFTRFLVVIGLAVTILRLTIMTLVFSNRSAFTLDFARSSPEAAPLSDDEFASVNPKNLFDCPKQNLSWSRPLTYLCIMDQTTVDFATLAAVLSLVEAVFTVILENRSRRKANGGRLTTMSKRDEVHVPSIPLHHLGNETMAATSTVQEANHVQKTLPPLPPRHEEEVEDIPQAFAYVPDHHEEGDDDQDEVLQKKSAWVTSHTSPFMVLDEKSKTMRPLSPNAHNNNTTNYADQPPPEHEYDATFGSSSSNAGPSNWRPDHQNDGTS